MRSTGYMKPYKALCSAVVDWFSTAVIGAFRSSLFQLFRQLPSQPVCLIFIEELVRSVLDQRRHLCVVSVGIHDYVFAERTTHRNSEDRNAPITAIENQPTTADHSAL